MKKGQKCSRWESSIVKNYLLPTVSNPIYRNQPEAMNPSICFKFCRQELKICALMHKFGIFAVSPLEKIHVKFLFVSVFFAVYFYICG